METDLNQLREHLIQHVQSADQVPLKKLGIFHTHQFQALRSVPIHQHYLCTGWHQIFSHV